MKLLNFTEIKFQYTENVSWACLEFLTSLGVKDINWALGFFPKLCPWWEQLGKQSSPQLLDLVVGKTKVIEGCIFYRFWPLARWLFVTLQVAYEIIYSFSHFHFFQEHKINTSFIEKKEADWESKYLVKYDIPKLVPRSITHVFWVKLFNSRY